MRVDLCKLKGVELINAVRDHKDSLAQPDRSIQRRRNRVVLELMMDAD